MKQIRRLMVFVVGICLVFAITGFQQADTVTITSPISGQTVSGTVLIEGTAGGPNFTYYKVEIAKGTTPGDDAWRLLSNQIYERPISNNSLESWDTTEYPDGVYSLRLRVVDNTGNYQEVVVSPITIQNTSPIQEVEPESKQESTFSPKIWTVDTVAREIETFNEITGAVYDSENSQLLLVGRFNPNWPTEATLKLDDLIAAFRVIYDGEFPAVSIDPGNDISVMDVKYFGNTEETSLGWTMFEADRLLKVYSMGLDNNTNQPVASNVPGYKSELDLASPSGIVGGPALWHRIWFEADDSDMTAVEQSSNKQAIFFDHAHMVVKTEYVSIDGSPNPDGSDPAAEAFVKHFNENFEDFAAEQPVFHRLNQVHRFLIIARWLRDQGIPLDKLWVSEYEGQPVVTPDTTPRRQVTREFGHYALALGGGVDFFAENNYSSRSSNADELAEVVLDLPSTNGNRQGEVKLNGVTYETITFPTQRKSYYIETDTAGNKWYIDNESGNPLAYIAADGSITNFDEFDELGRPVVVTTHQSQNKRTFIYNNGTLDTIHYENELDSETLETTFLADMRNLLTREVDGETPSDQGYNLFAQEDFPRPNWVPSEDSNGNPERLWPVTLEGEPIVIKEIDSKIKVNSTDLIEDINLNGNRFVILRGESAIYENTRIEAIRYSNDEVTFTTRPYPKNGGIAIQNGQQPEIFIPVPFAELESALINPDFPEDELDEMIANFGNIFTGEGNEVILSGQYPDSPEWTDVKQKAQQLSKNLGIALRTRGFINILNDDDPELALENLAAQQPIGNVKPLNLAAVFYNETFTSDQQVIADQLKNVFIESGVPVYDSLAEVQKETNVIVITAHNTEQLRQHIITLGESGILEGKSIVLARCGHPDEMRFLSDIVKQFGATAVASADGLLEMEGLLDIIPRFLERVEKRVETPVYESWNRTIQDILEDTEVPKVNKRRVRPYQNGNIYISQVIEESFYELPA